MNPGKLDRKITLQSLTVTRGAAGGAVNSFVDFATRSAEKVDTAGREFRAAGSLRAETTAVFRIRYLAGLTTRHQLVYESRAHDILEIKEEGRRVSQLIQARYTEGVA